MSNKHDLPPECGPLIERLRDEADLCRNEGAEYMSDRPPTILELQRARAKEAKRLMEVYDQEVYLPALRALRVWCAENGGHRSGKYHDNGLGWSWFYCTRCGGRMDISGPDGQEYSDDSALSASTLKENKA